MHGKLAETGKAKTLLEAPASPLGLCWSHILPILSRSEQVKGLARKTRLVQYQNVVNLATYINSTTTGESSIPATPTTNRL